MRVSKSYLVVLTLAILLTLSGTTYAALGFVWLIVCVLYAIIRLVLYQRI